MSATTKVEETGRGTTNVQYTKGREKKKKGMFYYTCLRREVSREGRLELDPRVHRLVRQDGAEGRIREPTQHQDRRHRPLLPEVHLVTGGFAIVRVCVCA